MATATKRPKPTRLTSPAGTLKFGWITKPSTKFVPAGEYTADILLTADEAKPLIEALTAEANKAKVEIAAEKPKVKTYKIHIPVQPEVDKEGNETGNFILKVKQKAQFTNKKTGETQNVTIPIFDAKKNPVPANVKLGRDSRVKASFDVVPFSMDATKLVGVTARLKAVQIIDLVEFGGGGDAGSFGFGDEDGFEAAGEAEAAETEAGGGNASDGGGSDF